MEEIGKIAKNSQLKLLWLCLTGGEPFLRSDLAEVAAAFCRYGSVVNLSIPTNGQLKREVLRTTEKILRSCPDTFVTISVSLDGGEATHDRVRDVRGAFAKAVDTVGGLKDLKRFPNFGLSVQTTVMSENQREIKDFYLFVRDKLKPDYMNLNLIRWSPKDPRLKGVDISFYEELVNLMWRDVCAGKWSYFDFPFNKLALVRNFAAYRHIARTYRENRFRRPCYSSRLSGVIDEVGNVFPCEGLKDAQIGNLREVDYDLSKLWFSERNKKLQKEIARGCFCTNECAVSVNTLFNPRLYPSFLKALLFKRAV